MTGKPRKTELELIVSGQWRRDRHGRSSASKTAVLGPPPADLGPVERKVWREVADSALWLERPDRPLLEVFVRLLAEARTDFTVMPASRLALLANLGARLGLAPGDRARLSPPPDRGKNPFDEFGP